MEPLSICLRLGLYSCRHGLETLCILLLLLLSSFLFNLSWLFIVKNKNKNPYKDEISPSIECPKKAGEHAKDSACKDTNGIRVTLDDFFLLIISFFDEVRRMQPMAKMEPKQGSVHLSNKWQWQLEMLRCNDQWFPEGPCITHNVA